MKAGLNFLLHSAFTRRVTVSGQDKLDAIHIARTSQIEQYFATEQDRLESHLLLHAFDSTKLAEHHSV